MRLLGEAEAPGRVEELPAVEGKCILRIGDRIDLWKQVSLDALFAECEGVKSDDVVDRIEALQIERAELETKIDKLMTNRASLIAGFEALFGQDQAAEARQDAANVEAEIGSLAQSYEPLDGFDLYDLAVLIYRILPGTLIEAEEWIVCIA